MDKKIIAHRVYFDEKYNRPYIRIYRTINGKSRYHEKFIYNIPNKRDYKYIDGLTHAVEMSCTKFKEFRKVNNIKISECEYFKSSHDDSFYYNNSRNEFFVKVTKKLYERFSKEDIIFKYSFNTKNRKLQIEIEEFKFNKLAEHYESIIEERLKKRKSILTRKINRTITRDFGKFDNLFPYHLDRISRRR